MKLGIYAVSFPAINFIKRLFGREKEVKDAASFWEWFLQHEKTFHTALSKEQRINEDFLDLLMSRLKILNSWFA
ncbi:MAG: hypothetical protein JST42_00665, partial [Bacteroidetes bacterium]|nr:hypothetical protein [Bacteroidota bacterium]